MPRRPAAFAFLVAIIAAPALADTLRGNGVALEVSEDTPLGIIALRHGPNAPALFVDETQVQTTWELVMVDPEGNELKLDPVTKNLGGNVAVTGDKLTMVWDAAEVATGSVKVSCTFEPDPEQPLIYGNITVENNSQCQLREVQFPRLTLVPNPEPAESITLVFPRAYGRSWRNPFDAPRGYLVGTMEPAGLRGSAEMQFGTIYDDAGNGLYWAAYDGEGYHKRFVYDNKQVRGQIQLKLAYIPENCLTPGVDFDSPYPIVLGAYQGDWWDAARMYRRWALQQKWCAKGPLETREDVPQWIKDCDVWVRGDAKRHNVELERDYAYHVQDFFGGAIGVQLYSWYPPEPKKPRWAATLGWPMVEGYPEMLAEAQQRAVYHTPYVNSYQTDLADPSCPTGVEAAFLLDAEGHPTLYGNETENRVMCAATELWKGMLVQACERLVRDGHAKGIYLDQLGGHCGRPCYSAEHGHPVGGGHYATDGLRAICAACREAMWQHDPDAALSGEVQHETLIDVTDHRLQHYNVWPGWVNLWAAVYGDMTATYGRTITWGGKDKEGNPTPDIQFFGRCGNTFVSGLQFARIWPSGDRDNWLNAPATKRFSDYFKLVVDLRRAGKKFLEFGYLQRRVRYLTDTPDLTMIDAKKREMKIKAVLDSAWRASDDSLGFVFANISDEPQEFTWEADLSRYEISDAEVYDLKQIMPDGKRWAVAQLETRLLKRTERMKPHSAMIYEVTVGAY